MQVKVGDKIKILSMYNEPSYDGRTGVVEYIDSLGQLHGTWGGLAIIPDADMFVLVVKDLEKWQVKKHSETLEIIIMRQ